VLINPDLEANLFDLAEVDFGAADGLIKAAAGRAALDDPAYVTSIDAPFTLADLSSLSAEKIASLKAQTLARLKPLDYPIEDIYIERNGASRKGGVTIEMRAWEQGPAHRWGAVVYDIDGAVVNVMKP
jgi:hypothetical protein